MIRDWLQEPSPTNRYSCNLSMKKTVFVLLLFALLLSLGIVQAIFIEKFDFVLPRFAHGLLFLFELITFLLFIHAIYPEKHRLLLPFAVAEILRVIVLAALIVYYIVLNLTKNESLTGMARKVELLFFVLIAYVFMINLVIATYYTLRNRGSSLKAPRRRVLTPGHHVVVLEQSIEEAMYGKRSQR